MNGKNYDIGAVWRRWDMHFHTPGTKKNDQFKGADLEEKWKNYIDDINAYAGDIAVVGVTDYVCSDNYFRFKKSINDGLITKSFDLVIPNVELRISPVTGSNIPINIHCIFNPTFDEQLEKRFFQKLKFHYNDRYYDATKADLISLGRDFKNDQALSEMGAILEGIKQYVVSFNDLKAIFDQDPALRENTIIIVANGKDGVGGLKDHAELLEGTKYSSLEATRQSIYKFTDAVFSSSQGDRSYFVGQKKNAAGIIIDDEKEVMRKCGSLMPCFHGSDAHENGKLFEPDDKRYCWVKSDPSFEGIKQVLFEPSERVRIGEHSPELDFEKPVFTSIEISKPIKVLNSPQSKLEFSTTKVPLNRGMVAIIGGRGQGKSMLINYLGHGLSQEVNEKLRDKINLDEAFVVNWLQASDSTERSFKLDQQKQLPFTFIYQSKVKEIADDNEALKREIIDILSGAGFQKPPAQSEEFEIQKAQQNYWNIRNWLEKRNSDGRLVNDKTAIEKSIEQTKEKIELVTEGSNRLHLEKYVENIGSVSLLEENNSDLRRFRNQIIEYRESLNQIISAYGFDVPLIDTQEQQKAIVVLYRENLRKKNQFEKDNQKIKDENFSDYKGDLSQLLDNLATYQREVVDLQAQVKEIDAQQTDLLEAKKKLNNLNKEQGDLLADEAALITLTWKNKIFDNPARGENENKLIKKLLADRNIDISGTIFFNESAFVVQLERLIDGRSLRPKTKEKIYEVMEIDKDKVVNDVLKYTVEKLERIRKDNPGCFYEDENNDIFKVFTDPTLRSKYLHVFAEITVDGKPLDELSAGQKGTVYLCLKLATQIFSGPIVFDQPEDDLDNDFITNELIELFKEIKKYRQVIIVSHNANLVVNSDSEQVIIAKNDSETLSYASGSLENETINKEICRILEGGERAFEKRRDKYRYVK